MTVTRNRRACTEVRALPPGPGARTHLGAAEGVAPVDQTDCVGAGRHRVTEEVGDGARVVAQTLFERGQVSRQGVGAQPVEPQLEVDAWLVRRDEVGGAADVAGLVPQGERGPAGPGV